MLERKRIIWGDGLSQREVIQNMNDFFPAIVVPAYFVLKQKLCQYPQDDINFGHGKMILDLSAIDSDEYQRHWEELAAFTLTINEIAANYGGMPRYGTVIGIGETMDLWNLSREKHYSQEFGFGPTKFLIK